MTPDTLTKSIKRRETIERKSARPKVAAPMSAEEIKPASKHNDLCLDCVHQSDCIYHRGSSGPVHDCDDYESSGVAVARPVETTARPASLGLCATCEHRENCTLTKPASGVWHCDEYR